MKAIFRTSIILAVVSLSVSIISGCSTYNRKTLNVTLSNSLEDNTIQVDIAGIKSKNIKTYYDINRSDYWALDSKYRSELTKNTIVFCPGDSLCKALSGNNAIWDIWNYNKDDFLLVAADLPPTVGNDTNWKLIIPMDYYLPFNFWSDRTSQFLVDMSGLMQIN